MCVSAGGWADCQQRPPITPITPDYTRLHPQMDADYPPRANSQMFVGPVGGALWPQESAAESSATLV